MNYHITKLPQLASTQSTRIGCLATISSLNSSNYSTARLFTAGSPTMLAKLASIVVNLAQLAKISYGTG